MPVDPQQLDRLQRQLTPTRQGLDTLLPPTDFELEDRATDLRRSVGLQPADVTFVAPQAPVVSPEAQEFLRTFSVPTQPTIGQAPTPQERLRGEAIREELTGIEPTTGVGLPGLQQAPEPGGFTIKNPQSRFFDLSPEDQQRFDQVRNDALIAENRLPGSFQRIMEEAGFGDIEEPFLPFGNIRGFGTEVLRGLTGDRPQLTGERLPRVQGAGPVSQIAGRFVGEGLKFAGLITALQTAGVTGVTADVVAGLLSGIGRQQGADEFDPLAPIVEAVELGTAGAVLRIPFAIRAARRRAAPAPARIELPGAAGEAYKKAAAAGRPVTAGDVFNEVFGKKVFKPKTSAEAGQQQSAEEVIDELVRSTEAARHTPVELDAIAAVYGKIDLTGKLKIGSVKERIKDAALRINTLLADDLAPLEFVEKKIRGVDKLDPKVIDPISSPTMMARAAARTASGKARMMALHGTFDFAGQTTGPSLQAILKPVSDDFINFVTYAYARRAVELWNRTKPINPGVSLEQAQITVNALETPARRAAHEGITGFENNVLRYLVDAGGLSEQAAKTIMDMNRAHIPLKRAIEGRTFIGGGGKALADLGQPVKPIRGSDLPIRNPIASILENTTAIISVADKVRVGKALIELTEEFPSTQTWVKKVKPPSEARRISVERIAKQLEGAGIEVPESSMQEVLDMYLSSGTYKGKDNVLSFWRNGKREFYQVESRLYGTLKAMDEINLPAAVDFVLGKPARAIRLGATGLNAGFGLITNPLRDAFAFGLQTEFTTGLPHLIGKGLIARLSPNNEMNLLFKRSGGDFSQFLGMDRRSFKQTIDQVMASTVRQRALNVVKHPIEVTKDLFSITEAAPRLAEFAGAQRNAALRFGPNSPQAQILGNLASSEVTVNFRRAGSLGKYINQMVPFWNAQIQGVSRFARFARDNPTKAAIKGIAGITIPTIGIWLLNKDREWYRESPAWMRYGFWNFEVGTEANGAPRILRIPRPFEWGIVYGAAPEMALDYMYSKDPAVVEQGLDYMIQQTLPFGITDLAPATMRTGFELSANYDYFRERPIDPFFEVKYKAPEDRFSPFTTETSKFLGRQFGMSPRKIDFLLSSATGGLARDLARFAEKTIGISPPATDLAANIPVVGRLFQRTQSPEQRSKQLGFRRDNVITRVRSLNRAGQTELATDELNRWNLRFPSLEITTEDLKVKRRR